MTTAAETAPASFPGLELGAEESQGSNRIYVALRTGKICQTSKEHLAGYRPAQTKNKDGSVNNFFAKEYDKLTGYITDVRWHTHKLSNGTILSGWNVTIDTTKEVYVLQVGTNDRPFERFMNTLLAVDFEKPVMFVAFMGKSKTTEAPQKVLLLSQELDPQTKKPVWIQPVLQERWLSLMLRNKLKQGIELTEAEERNVARNKDGSVNKEYPYITQGIDEKWSMDNWRNHLHEAMQEHVIPNVEAANQKRGIITRIANGNDIAPEEDAPMHSGPAPSSGAYDDDIPF